MDHLPSRLETLPHLLPPYPQDTLSFTIAGSGSLSAAQIQYSHPNVTLSGLTEDNIGSYMLTATNRRLISNTIIGSSTGSFNLTVLFPPVITSGTIPGGSSSWTSCNSCVCCPFTQLWPGLSYDITVVAISVFGGVSAVGPASNKETFNTEPNAPTVTCRDLIATSGSVNVSWTVVYNAIPANPSSSSQPTATSVIVREQFVSTTSYLFHISANNSVGISNIVTCGPVLIKEGIPVRPDEPQIISTKPGTITMTLSTAAIWCWSHWIICIHH
eukprot:Em0006g603a